MDNFIVSARKYRPLSFDDVVGQRHVTETLLHEIENNKLAQAFLFTGPRGVGKTTCARILAKVINSREMQASPDQDFAFNIFELDAASNNSVDDIRSLIDQVRIPPQVGKYKVYIIDEVHMLSTAAFNAFLKTLEEPPPYAIFILATTDKHKVLPTILSRCQVFNFNRILVRDMVEHLRGIAEKEGVKAETEALHLIAVKADGGLRDALSIFDQLVSFTGGDLSYARSVEILNVLDADVYFRLTEALLAEDRSSALLIFDDILGRGFDGQFFISGLSEHFRNLMVCREPATAHLLEVAEAFKPRYAEQAAKVDLSFLINALNFTNDADQQYKTSRNPRLLVELALLKLCHLREYVRMVPDIEALKKKFLSDD
jgi:DNA polymerase III subunit gamma/tau